MTGLEVWLASLGSCSSGTDPEDILPECSVLPCQAKPEMLTLELTLSSLSGYVGTRVPGTLLFTGP
jgi:hypothetical protein